MNRKDRRRLGAKGEGNAASATSSPAGTPTPFGADDALALLTGRSGNGKGGAAAYPEQPMAKGFVFSMSLAEASSALGSGRDLSVAIKAVAAVFAFAESVWKAANARITVKKIACKMGCAWCCYQQVSLTTYEAAAIVAHLRSTWAPERLSALMDRLRARSRDAEGLDGDAVRLKRLPCAFLEDNTCAIHAVRPFRCRGYNSVDADVCRYMYENAEEAAKRRKANALPLVFDGEAPQIFDDAQHGLAVALADAGVSYDNLELTRGVLIGLEQPEALARWVAGEDIFGPARIGEKPA